MEGTETVENKETKKTEAMSSTHSHEWCKRRNDLFWKPELEDLALLKSCNSAALIYWSHEIRQSFPSSKPSLCRDFDVNLFHLACDHSNQSCLFLRYRMDYEKAPISITAKGESYQLEWELAARLEQPIKRISSLTMPWPIFELVFGYSQNCADRVVKHIFGPRD